MTRSQRSAASFCLLLRTFRLGVVQRKVQIREITNLGLWDGHTDHFSVPKFSIIRNSRKVVIAYTSLFVGGFSAGVTCCRCVLGWFSAQNILLSLNDKLVLDVPEALTLQKMIRLVDEKKKIKNEKSSKNNSEHNCRRAS